MFGGGVMDNVIIGVRIKSLRLKNKMTREELAEAADISSSFLYEIETGKKSFSAYTLGSLSRALSVKSDYILHGEFQEKNKRDIDGNLSVQSLICIQQILLEAYNEIQELIDM